MIQGAPMQKRSEAMRRQPRAGRKREAALGAPEELYEAARHALIEGDRAAARDALDRLGRSFETHFALEDRVYFPALATLRPDLAGALRQLRDEHDRMSACVADLLRAIAGGESLGLVSTLDELITGFQRHEGIEEAILGSLERPTA